MAPGRLRVVASQPRGSSVARVVTSAGKYRHAMTSTSLQADVPGVRVRVDGRAVPIERYAGLGYARFAFEAGARVELEADGPPGAVRVVPAAAAEVDRIEARRVRLRLPEPANLVVWLGDREPVCLFADAPEQPPRADDPGVEVVEPEADGGDATARIQAALDRAAGRPGGGTVVLAAGRHPSGTLRVGSHTTLYLAAGSVLEGLADPAAYPVDAGFTESARDASLPPDARFWGRTMTFSRLLLVDDATDVRIAGRGTIAGNGLELRTRHGAVPNLIRVRRSRLVTIEDLLLRDAAAWTVHVLGSEDVDIRNVRILNDRGNLNTDGIDPDHASHVRIDRCFIWTKDDAVCVKATGNGGVTGDVRDVRVTRCVLSSRDAALKVGTETATARIEDVTFEDCDVFDSGRAMSVVVRDGAVLERIAFRGIRVGPRVQHLVEQVIGVRDPRADLGVIRDLEFDGIEAPDYAVPERAWTWYAQFRPGRPAAGTDVPVFAGADEAHAVEGLRLHGVVVGGVPVTDEASAAGAGLAIGPFVRNVHIG